MVPPARQRGLTNRRARRGAAVLLAAALAACARRHPVVVEEEPGTVVCRAGPDCDAKWARARQWVTAHSRWKIGEDTAVAIATEGPVDSLSPAFAIRRLVRPERPGSEAIVFSAGCSPERVQAFVDHVPRRGARWRNVAGPGAKHTECEPPVDQLEADFVHFVTAEAAR